MLAVYDSVIYYLHQLLFAMILLASFRVDFIAFLHHAFMERKPPRSLGIFTLSLAHGLQGYVCLNNVIPKTKCH